MSRWSNALRAKFYEFNGNTFNKNKYTKISEFLIKEYLWRESWEDSYNSACVGRKYDDCTIFIAMANEVIAIGADRIEYYTDNDNDCIRLRINKHYSRILCLDYIEDMRFESSFDDDCGLGNILS